MLEVKNKMKQGQEKATVFLFFISWTTIVKESHIYPVPR